jgi:hypothetical protein
MIHEYPFHMLPEIGLVDSVPVGEDHARQLSENEKDLIQCAYAWMQTHDGEIPPLTAASFSELWFLVKSMGTLQCNVKALSLTHMRHYVEAHKAKYEATGPKHNFLEILNHDFSYLEKVLRMCVKFEADLAEVRAWDRANRGM